MASRIRRPLLLLLLAHMALTSGQIRLFINQLPEYSALAPCTEVPVSTVVRITSDGCGDGSQTISYHYFCRTSSSYFSSLIGSRDRTPDVQRTSAVGLFGTYFDLVTHLPLLCPILRRTMRQTWAELDHRWNPQKTPRPQKRSIPELSL
jgi:hypothetical protein